MEEQGKVQRGGGRGRIVLSTGLLGFLGYLRLFSSPSVGGSRTRPNLPNRGYSLFFRVYGSTTSSVKLSPSETPSSSMAPEGGLVSIPGDPEVHVETVCCLDRDKSATKAVSIQTKGGGGTLGKLLPSPHTSFAQGLQGGV